MKQNHLITLGLALLILGYTTFFTSQLTLHYYSFGSRAFDLGNMGQAIWNTSQGRWFHQTNQPGANNRLSLHVEPILIPLSWLYYIYSGPEILFLVQSLVVALGAIPVFALARAKLGTITWGFIFALIYLLFPALQAATLLDFHAVTLAPTFLLAAFYFLERNQPKPFGLFAVLAVACKEDMTLLVLMLALYALIIKRQYRLGGVTLALCFTWAAIAVFVIPPMFARTDNIHWGRYYHLGHSPSQIVLNLFLQPQLFWQHLVQVQALNYLSLLLQPTAFIALLNPVTLLLALPSLGINLLSDFPAMQEVNHLIYAAPIVPAIIISSIYGVANLRKYLTPALSYIREGAKSPPDVGRIKGDRGDEHPHPYPLPMGEGAKSPPDVGGIKGGRGDKLPLPLGEGRGEGKKPWHSWFNLIMGAILLIASFRYQAQHGYLPGAAQYRGWEVVTDHHRRAAQIIAQIPPEAKLSAQDRLNPHASHRQTLYIFDRLDDADHILLDVTEDSWPLHPVALRDNVMDLLRGDFKIVAARDGYLLLAKQPNGLNTLPDPFFDFARAPQPIQPQFATNLIFDDKLQLLGYDLTLGAHEDLLPQVTLYWRALKPLSKDYTLWPFFINRQGQLIENPAERPLVTTLWYPTSRWSTEEIIMTRTLPRDLGAEFTLAVGVAEKNWDGSRLSITQNNDNLFTFEKNSWARLNSFSEAKVLPTVFSPYRVQNPITEFMLTYLNRKNYSALTMPAETAPSTPLAVEFWSLIQLKGVDLPAAPLLSNEPLQFSLHWQTSAPLTIDLTAFAHLLNEQGQTVAQLDWTPQDALGYLPTTAWQPQRTVIDHQSMPLNNLPSGQYRLIIGWYYAVTGQRLPITSAQGGEEIEVGVIQVK